MLYHVIYRTMVVAAVAVTAAALVSVALVGHLEDVSIDEAISTRVTEIYKNQLHPSIGELHARVIDSGKAHSTWAIKRRGQWI
jgi:hypothetical protein